jgi:hypothetical protein
MGMQIKPGWHAPDRVPRVGNIASAVGFTVLFFFCSHHASTHVTMLQHESALSRESGRANLDIRRHRFT